jgi:tetratricopeptide (TPR) repeat protein
MNRKNNAQQNFTRAVEIEQLEVKLTTDPDNLTSITQLGDLYLADNRESKATPFIKKAAKLFKDSQLSVTQGFPVYELLLKHWKMDRFVNKGSMRINITEDRKKKLRALLDLTMVIHKMRDPMHQQNACLKLAYVKECSGSFQDSLTLLSDLITTQASNGVDLSYIIFKAAVLLKHIGENKQAIEYLEYLQEDPPLEGGFNKLHIIAFLILVYEQSEEKYRVFLSKAYKDLSTSLDDEEGAERAQTPSKQTRKLLELVKSKTLKFSSELWELLAFQALDRCEYVVAAEFLYQATLKAPNKGPLLHCLIEVLFLLGEKEAAGRLGDKAMILLPASADLRNLLLQIDPEKWGDKLRFVGPTTAVEREGLSSAQDARDTSPPKGPTPGIKLIEDEQPPPPATAPPKELKKKASAKSKDNKQKEKEKDKDNNETKSKNSDSKDSVGKKPDTVGKKPAVDEKPAKDDAAKNSNQPKQEKGFLSRLKSSLQAIPNAVRAKSPPPEAQPKSEITSPVVLEKKPSFKQESGRKTPEPLETTDSRNSIPPIDDEARRILKIALHGGNVSYCNAFLFYLMLILISSI